MAAHSCQLSFVDSFILSFMRLCENFHLELKTTSCICLITTGGKKKKYLLPSSALFIFATDSNVSTLFSYFKDGAACSLVSKFFLILHLSSSAYSAQSSPWLPLHLSLPFVLVFCQHMELIPSPPLLIHFMFLHISSLKLHYPKTPLCWSEFYMLKQDHYQVRSETSPP